jgi:hypothetical protein
LQRKLPQYLLFTTYQKDFLLYQQVLAQKPKDKNKIYSLHEANVYVIAKGKDHKQYEYGNKVSIVSTKDSNIIVGVVSHNKNIHDSKTLHAAIGHAKIAIEIKTRSTTLLNVMVFCQLVKAIDNLDCQFGISRIGDVFFLYGGVN